MRGGGMVSQVRQIPVAHGVALKSTDAFSKNCRQPLRD